MSALHEQERDADGVLRCTCQRKSLDGPGALDMLVDATGRFNRIAHAHAKDVDEHGGTSGDCRECWHSWPCPTYVWATTDRDPNATWDPADDAT